MLPHTVHRIPLASHPILIFPKLPCAPGSPPPRSASHTPPFPESQQDRRSKSSLGRPSPCRPPLSFSLAGRRAALVPGEAAAAPSATSRGCGGPDAARRSPPPHALALLRSNAADPASAASTMPPPPRRPGAGSPRCRKPLRWRHLGRPPKRSCPIRTTPHQDSGTDGLHVTSLLSSDEIQALPMGEYFA
ncbi:hypothetical protein PVAP13_6KG219200 [Panicum virgatum]|uniref:Uncharacterized protein n=1 Tax=Panicum virgatum TaxID=38727 RepID=A0A8T0RE95_PANVG|nr:hypothetical protein PVAP13_6KG219200 [Panicum virgatum]KAG2583451.1 hypothetical protein PVAP13_6KG219200 [Panicum virgatum]